jgi:hypothetical protein
MFNDESASPREEALGMPMSSERWFGAVRVS